MSPVTVTKLPGNVPDTLSAPSAVSISTAVSRFLIKFEVLVVASSIACKIVAFVEDTFQNSFDYH